MSNIVFFGQADAGKSTLAGYLISRYEKGFSLSAFIQSMQQSIPDFDISLAFSSIINTNRDELQNINRMNSKSLHLRRVSLPFEKVTIIDTPGSENYRKQRERGMFYGDVGVFFMEINNILEHKYKIDTIAPIALWSKLENKRMIFLLTKFDTVGYEEEAYKNALEEVNGVCSYFGFSGQVTVIPTAIEVEKLITTGNIVESIEAGKRDLGENICSKSDRMPWFSGPNVVDAIRMEISSLDQKNSSEPLMFCVTDQIDRPYSSAGKVWSIKLLSGILNVGDEICLAPVKDKNNQFQVLTANVKQIRNDVSRFDEQEEILTARKGNIYGLDIKNCHIGRRHTKKTEYDAVSTTCGFSSNSQYLMSHFFSFEIDKTINNQIKPGRLFRLLWFGRALPFYVEEVQDLDSNQIVHGKLMNTEIAFPIYGIEEIQEPILIKGEGIQDFYKGILKTIGNKQP